MRMYCCQCQVIQRNKNGTTCSRQVPTFYLHPHVQGCVSIRHAESIAKEACNITHDPKLEVQVSVAEVDIA